MDFQIPELLLASNVRYDPIKKGNVRSIMVLILIILFLGRFHPINERLRLIFPSGEDESVLELNPLEPKVS